MLNEWLKWGWCAWVLSVREIVKKENKELLINSNRDHLDKTQNEKLWTFDGNSEWSNEFDEIGRHQKEISKEKILFIFNDYHRDWNTRRNESETLTSLKDQWIVFRFFLKFHEKIYFSTRQNGVEFQKFTKMKWRPSIFLKSYKKQAKPNSLRSLRCNLWFKLASDQLEFFFSNVYD